MPEGVNCQNRSATFLCGVWIETTDEIITTVAYSVGFHDVGYFGKCFKQKYGKTPKDYRADFRNG